jgi:glyoxylase-like metal-dependent hydrolase (beta-lactamase superfamily II)
MAAEGVRIELVTSRANTWIVGDDAEVIVIDPGEDAAAVLDAVGEREVLAVICTHGHVGHTGAAVEVAKRDDAPVALHPADRLAWREVHSGGDPEIDIEDGGIFEVAGVALEVLHAPGHTRGSCCLYSEDLDVVFAGDVVGENGPVPRREGFPNWAKQLDAIGAQILTLPPDTRILPGHGDELTVAIAEKRFNTWVAAGPDQDYLAEGFGDSGSVPVDTDAE